MEVILATFRVKPEHIDAFEEMGKQLVEATHKEPGCKTYRLHKSADNTYVFYEVYEDAAALKAHMKGPALQAAMAKFPLFLDGPPKVEKLAVVEG